MTIWQVIGVFLFLDDTIRNKDFGKFDRLHHYHLGLALILFGG